jgi:hypothetical protein
MPDMLATEVDSLAAQTGRQTQESQIPNARVASERITDA